MKVSKFTDAGFVQDAGDGGDFCVRDDSDGSGPYIQWLRQDVACPFPDQVREPPKPTPPKDHPDAAEIAAAEQEQEDMKKAAEIVADAVKQVETASAAAEARVNAALQLAAEAVAQRDAAIADAEVHKDRVAELEAAAAASDSPPA